MQVADDAKGVIVVDVAPGAPADEAGLRAGDVIAAVDGLKTADPATTAKSLRGEAGSTCSVLYVRDGAEKTTTINRRVVPLSTVRGDGGAIRVKGFQLDTAPKVADLAGKAKGPLVLDLRGNLGGSLEGGVETARLFLKTGQTITTVVDARGTPFPYEAVADGPFYGRKLSILVDSRTASAAEQETPRPGFALSFKRTTRACRRRKNDRTRSSSRRGRRAGPPPRC